MILRCPVCNYDMTDCVSERCPECGRVSTVEELEAWSRIAAHPHPRADIVGHGCVILFLLLIAYICGATALGYGAPLMVIGVSICLMLAYVFSFSLRRQIRRWRAHRDVD